MRLLSLAAVVAALALAGCQGRGADAGRDIGPATRRQEVRRPAMDSLAPRPSGDTRVDEASRVRVSGSVTVGAGVGR